MDKKRLFTAMLMAVCVLFQAAAASSAQPVPPLAPSPLVPVADGKIGADEYSWHGTLKDMKLELSLSADSSTLCVALEAPTAGWASVGLGRLKMNGAFMVIGYDNKGTAAVSEQTGVLFGHKENKTTILRESAVGEQNGATILEFSLPAAAYLSQPSLKLIAAYGKQDNFTSKHAKYEVREVPLVK